MVTPPLQGMPGVWVMPTRSLPGRARNTPTPTPRSPRRQPTACAISERQGPPFPSSSPFLSRECRQLTANLPSFHLAGGLRKTPLQLSLSAPVLCKHVEGDGWFLFFWDQQSLGRVSWGVLKSSPETSHGSSWTGIFFYFTVCGPNTLYAVVTRSDPCTLLQGPAPLFWAPNPVPVSCTPLSLSNRLSMLYSNVPQSSRGVGFQNTGF